MLYLVVERCCALYRCASHQLQYHRGSGSSFEFSTSSSLFFFFSRLFFSSSIFFFQHETKKNILNRTFCTTETKKKSHEQWEKKGAGFRTILPSDSIGGSHQAPLGKQPHSLNMKTQSSTTKQASSPHKSVQPLNNYQPFISFSLVRLHPLAWLYCCWVIVACLWILCNWTQDLHYLSLNAECGTTNKFQGNIHAKCLKWACHLLPSTFIV